MRCFFLPLALSWVGVCSSVTWAVDYGKIDRTIKTEPAYRSKSPQYALLIFGREAKTRVWVVLDGNTVYLDRNGDGDLTGKDERFSQCADCKGIEIADADGRTRYLITDISYLAFPEGPQLRIAVDIMGPIRCSQRCDADVRASPQDAPIAHFNGPLTVQPFTHSPGIGLPSDKEAVMLDGQVGTINAKYGCHVVVYSETAAGKPAFPKGVSPVVDIEFPSKRPGGAAVKRRYVLDQVC
jgi:hypothetical protein